MLDVPTATELTPAPPPEPVPIGTEGADVVTAPTTPVPVGTEAGAEYPPGAEAPAAPEDPAGAGDPTGAEYPAGAEYAVGAEYAAGVEADTNGPPGAVGPGPAGAYPEAPVADGTVPAALEELEAATYEAMAAALADEASATGQTV